MLERRRSTRESCCCMGKHYVLVSFTLAYLRLGKYLQRGKWLERGGGAGGLHRKKSRQICSQEIFNNARTNKLHLTGSKRGESKAAPEIDGWRQEQDLARKMRKISRGKAWGDKSSVLGGARELSFRQIPTTDEAEHTDHMKAAWRAKVIELRLPEWWS